MYFEHWQFGDVWHLGWCDGRDFLRGWGGGAGRGGLVEVNTGSGEEKAGQEEVVIGAG